MSNRSAQAQRYAQAAFQALLEQWHTVLEKFAAAIQNDSQLYGLLMDGTKDFSEREQALVSALPEGTPAELHNMLKLMLQEGDLDLVIETAQALQRLGTGEKAPTRADIVSADELSQEDEDAIRSSLTRQYGNDLIFSFRVDPALLGGLRVRVGDRLIDTSVASRLASLRESLASAVR